MFKTIALARFSETTLLLYLSGGIFDVEFEFMKCFFVDHQSFEKMKTVYIMFRLFLLNLD